MFKAEISNERGRFKIMRDGIELTRSDGIRIKRNGTQVILTLACASLDDAGFYQILTNGGESFAELIVEEKPVEFKDSGGGTIIQRLRRRRHLHFIGPSTLLNRVYSEPNLYAIWQVADSSDQVRKFNLANKSVSARTQQKCTWICVVICGRNLNWTLSSGVRLSFVISLVMPLVYQIKSPCNLDFSA